MSGDRQLIKAVMNVYRDLPAREQRRIYLELDDLLRAARARKSISSKTSVSALADSSKDSIDDS